MPLESPGFDLRLERTSFPDLFQRLDRSLLDSFWREGKGFERLQSVVLDRSANPRSRFLAAEILFVRDPGYPHGVFVRELSEVYAGALSEAPGTSANPWGLPGLRDGQIELHLATLGKAIIPAFRPLLVDVRPVRYDGSQEATYGNSYGYRVKDLAASLVAAAAGIPFVPPRDPLLRDAVVSRIAESTRSMGDHAPPPTMDRK